MPVCRVKNARKVSNLAVLFALHTRFLPQKTASPANCQQALVQFWGKPVHILQLGDITKP
ncbi:hypothetical protein EGK75_00915 [Neisseria weixii]|uniref:Uncharacterized protein n=1 Tax=Neisseria weixii TaxID=1853276 RepID=A0A3N4NHF6_9NEIS|nr:hypothetical protein EGK74_00910 [Neisseria weixii]RPD91133.1 hypothetical protein EGK75_00915 [Neisseria weixii]